MLCAQSRIHRVPCRVEWQRQARLLAVLCCGVLGSTQDVLLELAAARLLTLLLDPSSWACFPECKGLTSKCHTNCVSLLKKQHDAEWYPEQSEED